MLQIDTIYDGNEIGTEPGESDTNMIDTLGEPIKDFKVLNEKLTAIDSNGFVKKLIFEEGGGMPIDEDFTVYLAFSAYWENEKEPFDVVTIKKPLVSFLNSGLTQNMIIVSTNIINTNILLCYHSKTAGPIMIKP